MLKAIKSFPFILREPFSQFEKSNSITSFSCYLKSIGGGSNFFFAAATEQ
jgi:hypothetical protein